MPHYFFIFLYDTYTNLGLSAGSKVSNALSTMKSNMAEYKVGDIICTTRTDLNDDWINLTDTNLLSISTYDPIKYSALFDVLVKCGYGPTSYSTGDHTDSNGVNPNISVITTGTYSLQSGTKASSLYNLNNTVFLLYFNESESLWHIRKFKTVITFDDARINNSSNYTDYSIPGSSTWDRYSNYSNMQSGYTIVYINGYYILTMKNNSTGAYIFKYSTNLISWSSCVGDNTLYTTTNFANGYTIDYCNGYYYIIIASTTVSGSWNLLYTTSLTGTFSTAALNFPTLGIPMSKIYYVNGKYSILIGYNAYTRLELSIQLYQSSSITGSYSTQYNISVPHIYIESTFSIYDCAIYKNNNWIMYFYDISSGNEWMKLYIYNFTLSTCISERTDITGYNDKPIITCVTDNYIVYSTLHSSNSGRSAYNLLTYVNLNDMSINTATSVGLNFYSVSAIIVNNAYVLLSYFYGSDNSVYLRLCAPTTIIFNNNAGTLIRLYYIKGK